MKKVVALLMMIILGVGLFAGCKSDTSPAETDSKKTKVEADMTENAKKTEAPVKLRILGNLSQAENTTLGNQTIAMLEEKFNVELEFEIPPAANYQERVQLTFVSADMPDAIIFDSTSDAILRDAAEQGNIIPVNEYLESADNLLAHTEQTSFNAFKLLDTEEVFGIPRSTVIRADGIGIRKDWLEALGIEVEEGKPISKDTFLEIARRFATDDPDGNGVNDTYGLAMGISDKGEMVSLYNPNSVGSLEGVFGLLGWQEIDGEDVKFMDLKLSQNSDKFKNYLAFLGEYYTKGYLDPDWPVMKANQVSEKFEQGKYGMQIMFPLHVEPKVEKLRALNEKADLTWVTGIINEEAGKVTGSSFSSGAWGGWTITKNCKNPQLLVDILNYMLSDEFYYDHLIYGGEGTGFEMVDGKRSPLELYTEKVGSLSGIGWNNRLVRRAGDSAVYVSLTMSEEDQAKYQKWLDATIGNAVISKHGSYIPEVATSASFVDYQNRMNDVITRIIIGELESDAYDEALAGWYKAGGDKYVEQMNAYIEKMN